MSMENNQPLSQQLPTDLIALLRRHNMLQPLLRHELIDECVKNVAVSDQERNDLIQRFRQQSGLDADFWHYTARCFAFLNEHCPAC